MSRTKIKICGIREPEHAQVAADAGADWIGVVFVEKSPRSVTPVQAHAVVSTARHASATAVGLFADADAQTVEQNAVAAGLRTVQLHGHEPHAILDELAGMTVWKALPFGPGLLDKAEPWDEDPRIEALLIDTPPTGTLTGGSGVAFDWEALAGVKDKLQKPIILAGGLTPENVGEAIRTVRPYAVDVSSGVESSRGVKDVGLITAFCEAVRAADDTIAGL